MSSKVIIEAVGYIGSALVLVSFLMSSVVKLRIVNTVGSLIFMIYALIIKSYPTAVMNLALVLINLHYLRRMRSTEKKTYDLIETKPQDAYFQFALQKWQADIQACFPGVRSEPDAGDQAYIINCDNTLAGIIFGRKKGSTFDYTLDYATPAYRDCSVGRFFLEHIAAEGVKELTYSGPTVHHAEYLQKMGFQKNGDVYSRKI